MTNPDNRRHQRRTVFGDLLTTNRPETQTQNISEQFLDPIPLKRRCFHLFPMAQPRDQRSSQDILGSHEGAPRNCSNGAKQVEAQVESQNGGKSQFLMGKSPF